MGMLSLDSKPRVKTKEEIKEEKIKETKHRIELIKDEIDDLEDELKNFLTPNYLKDRIKNHKESISNDKIQLANEKKKLNKLT